MNYYHICTEGIKDNVLFKCSEDYVCAMNYVAITCIEQDIRLLAFCIMSNHFHFVVRTEFSKAKKFIISVKRRYSLNHWHKYGGHKLLAGRKHPIRIKEIQDTDYLKSAIAYVLRNPLSSFGELFWVYPWSSLGAYFNGMFTRNPGIILNDKSRRYITRVLHSNANIVENDLNINHSGYIPPKRYVDYKTVESIFVTPKSLLYYLNKNRDMEMEIEFTSLSKKISMGDNEVLDLLPTIITDNFGVDSISLLSLKQKIDLAKVLQTKFYSSPKQIARVLNLNPDIFQ